jgi:hypothetical protein
LSAHLKGATDWHDLEKKAKGLKAPSPLVMTLPEGVLWALHLVNADAQHRPVLRVDEDADIDDAYLTGAQREGRDD